MTATLSPDFVDAAAEQIRNAGVDGWLLYDLEARNKVAAELIGLADGQSRRWFVLLRPDGPPAALAHRIELGEWEVWPYELDGYVGWEEMEKALTELLSGSRSVAMEVSARDAVPFMDNVPAGVVELVESCGVEVVSSSDLISRTYAQWGDRGRSCHREAAAALAETARAAFELAVRAVGMGAGTDGNHGTPLPADEFELAEWIRAELTASGLTGVDTIVGIGPNSAKPHYWPPSRGSTALVAGEVLLIDLWGRLADEPQAVFADQTWMGFLGSGLPSDVIEPWEAVRDARDAGVTMLREAGSELPTGSAVDRTVREVLLDRGFGDAIFHRTGHAMDRVNHGFGPNLDSVETRDDRRLVTGIGFSVEPGLYFDGRFGLRSEINVHLTDGGPEVTPEHIQQDVWLP